MTRKDQIEKESLNHANTDEAIGFVEGALWADAHPDFSLICRIITDEYNCYTDFCKKNPQRFSELEQKAYVDALFKVRDLLLYAEIDGYDKFLREHGKGGTD